MLPSGITELIVTTYAAWGTRVHGSGEANPSHDHPCPSNPRTPRRWRTRPAGLVVSAGPHPNRNGSPISTCSPESPALAALLHRRGFVCVGPTTMFTPVQATGIIDTHRTDTHRRCTSGILPPEKRSRPVVFEATTGPLAQSSSDSAPATAGTAAIGRVGFRTRASLRNR